jgi:hypothetical protein
MYEKKLGRNRVVEINEKEEYSNFLTTQRTLLDLEADKKRKETRLWDMQMQCYLSSNAECLAEYNSAILDYANASRIKQAIEIRCMDQCNCVIESILRNPESPHNDPRCRSFHCLNSCLAKILPLTRYEIESLDDGITKLDPFLP